MKIPAGEKLLAVYSGVLTLAFAAVLLMGQRKVSFDEINAQRINIVEPDGTLRMTISSSARAPGVIMHGKEYPRPDRRLAGILFFNDEGTENGGLIFDGSKGKDGKVSSHGHLSFDAYDQDQVMVIEANQDATEHKSAFIQINDMPQYSLQTFWEQEARNSALSSQQQQAARERFFKEHPAPAVRALLGRLPDGSSELALKDAQGRDRIVIKVAADGEPLLQLLDAHGKVLDQLPRARH